MLGDVGWFSWRRAGRVAAWYFGILAVLFVAIMVWGLWEQHREERDPLNAFTIESFHADWELDDDGTLEVVETIVVDFPPQTNRGIIRTIPTAHRERSTRVRHEYSEVDGRPAADLVDLSEDDVISIRIGDPARYLEGRHTLTVAYSVEHTVQTYGEVQELFWDVNGDDWLTPIDKVSVRLRIAPELTDARTGELRCLYEGQRACAISGDSSLVEASAQGIPQRSTMTISVPFRAGTLPDEIDGSVVTGRWIVGTVVLLWTLCVLGMLGWNATRQRRWARDMVPLAQFTPPEDVPPYAAAEIYGVPERGVMASIVDAAIEGSVDLTKRDGDLYLAPGDVERERGDLADAAVRMALGRGGHEPVRVADGLADERGVREFTKTRTRYLRSKRSPVRLRDRSLTEMAGPILGATTFVILSLATTFGLSAPWILGSLVVWGLAWAVAAGVSARWVRLKADRRPDFHHLEGMREYIQLTDADRLRLLQGPDTAERVGPADEIRVYERLLPYAIVFGLEDDWVREMGRAGRLDQLDWAAGDVAGLVSSGSTRSTIRPFASGSAFDTPDSGRSGGRGGGGSSSSRGGSSGGSSGGGGGGRGW